MPRSVKALDDTPAPPLIDHVGFRLFQASAAWQERFGAEMRAAGYAWFGEARSALIPHIDRGGTRQADLPGRLGMTKQAIQQLVDALAADGIVERRRDPADARGRLVCFTREGLSVLAEANVVKRRIEAAYRRAMGAAAWRALDAGLAALRKVQEPGVD